MPEEEVELTLNYNASVKPLFYCQTITSSDIGCPKKHQGYQNSYCERSTLPREELTSTQFLKTINTSVTSLLLSTEHV